LLGRRRLKSNAKQNTEAAISVVAFPFSRGFDLHMRKAAKEFAIVAGVLVFITIAIGIIRLAAHGLTRTSLTIAATVKPSARPH
jgi:hypothetical protein